MLAIARKTLMTVHFRLLATAVWATVDSQAIQPSFTVTIPSTKFSTMLTNTKKFDPNDLRKRLSDIEYAVTQEKATEPPFTGKYLKNKKPGTYTCVVCGSKLFSSHDKFESGCGWPAFSEVLTSDAIVLTPDFSLGMKRTEVTCKSCGAHLGHVFDDGPPPKRTRYCINSAAMAFSEAAAGNKDEL